MLGGTYQEDSTEVPSEDDEIADIVGRCALMDTRIATLPVRGTRVGNRPSRSAVRLELDRISQRQPIIHNYGHGGGGVTLSWGCAEEVAELVRDLV